MRIPLRRHTGVNAFQAIGLLLGLLLIIAAAAWLVGGFRLMVLMVCFGVFLAVFLPRYPVASIMSTYKAEPLDTRAFPLFDVLFEDLSKKAGLEQTPRLYRVPCHGCNAFAVGTRNGSAIAVTNGMLNKLEPEELLAVLAHEIVHIQTGDTGLMSFTDVLSRMAGGLMLTGIGLLGLEMYLLFNGVPANLWPAALLLLVTPVIINGMQALISRGREYKADKGAALLTEDPAALASALQKLHAGEMDFKEYLLPSIVSHLPQPSLLRRHPPSEKRVEHLLMLMADNVPPSHMTEEAPLYFSDSNF